MAKISRLQRIGFFLLTFIWLGVGFVYFKGSEFLLDPIYVILFSSLLMLAFVSCFLEHFFTRPTDVIASTLSILLLMAPLRQELIKYGEWYGYFMGYTILLLVSALSASLLLDDKKATSSYCNIASQWLKHFSSYFGKGKLLYGTLFILTLLFYVDSQANEFLWLFGTAAVLLIVDPKSFIQNLPKNNKGIALEIGKIFGVQSKNIFLVKLFNKRETKIKRFDFVEFHYSMDDDKQLTRKGLVIDNFLLNEEQQIKVLYSREIKESFKGLSDSRETFEDNVVYQIPKNITKDNKFLEKFVGIVIENSNIEEIKFEYTSNSLVSEGDLLEVRVRDKTILYQIVQGMTDIEMLESKNETGMIVGKAIQLGEWNSQDQKFEKFGWVPAMNSPVMLASDIKKVALKEGEYEVGKVPNTNFPCIINTTDAISHHLAVLGVTGSGKSVFSRELIRHIAQDDWKVICIDFTGEYKGRFNKLNPVPIVSISEQPRMFEAIEALSEEMAKWPRERNSARIQKCNDFLEKGFHDSIQSFLESESNKLSVFELPDVSNTETSLEYTKWFFKVLFTIAKKHKNYGERICVVLEEAHTIVPEWNFAGTGDKTSQGLVNSVAQIALQGRKYDIGFIVIAQRTANVSKTVLTQCNSIITFQQFDKTSGDFFGNLFGKEMVAALPRLKARQAIAVGKGFKANMPMIFEVGEIPEEEFEIPDSFKEDKCDDESSGEADNNNKEPSVKVL